MLGHIQDSLKEAADALSELRNNAATIQIIEEAAGEMVKTFEGNGRVFSCGNGGSMCDAMHFAEELSGRFRLDRKGLSASAISDPGHMSCVSNDFGYEYVFSRYIEAHGRTGDVLLGISTSGRSKNVIMAAEAAKKIGMTVISLTGKKKSDLGDLADYDICTPAGKFADRCQELHIKIIHILIELVERRMFPENYR